MSKKVTLQFLTDKNIQRRDKLFLTSRPHYIFYRERTFKRTGEDDYLEEVWGEPEPGHTYEVVPGSDEMTLVRK